MRTLNTTQTEQIETFLKSLNCDIDIIDYVNIEDIDLSDAYNSIYDLISDNNGFDVEIIYYSRAIEYLKENDPSLRFSLELASDFGFDPKNLNSEILASLLASENARESFSELQSEIEDFFNELENEDEDED